MLPGGVLGQISAEVSAEAAVLSAGALPVPFVDANMVSKCASPGTVLPSAIPTASSWGACISTEMAALSGSGTGAELGSDRYCGTGVQGRG